MLSTSAGCLYQTPFLYRHFFRLFCRSTLEEEKPLKNVFTLIDPLLAPVRFSETDIGTHRFFVFTLSSIVKLTQNSFPGISTYTN